MAHYGCEIKAVLGQAIISLKSSEERENVVAILIVTEVSLSSAPRQCPKPIGRRSVSWTSTQTLQRKGALTCALPVRPRSLTLFLVPHRSLLPCCSLPGTVTNWQSDCAHPTQFLNSHQLTQYISQKSMGTILSLCMKNPSRLVRAMSLKGLTSILMCPEKVRGDACPHPGRLLGGGGI